MDAKQAAVRRTRATRAVQLTARGALPQASSTSGQPSLSDSHPILEDPTAPRSWTPEADPDLACHHVRADPKEAPVRLTRAVQRVRNVIRMTSAFSSSRKPPVLPHTH